MIDLLLGGSPCQGFSFAGKQLNFDDPRSKLFFDYVEALEVLKPRYFLLENVKMKKEYQDVISEKLGVEPIEINSALVSAQNRKRLYWTNIPGVKQPTDKGILLRDILESGEVDRDKSYCLEKKRKQLVLYGVDGKSPTLTTNKCEGVKILNSGCIQIGEAAEIKGFECIKRVYSPDGKSPTISTCQGGHREPKVSTNDTTWRKLTPIECERLQTLPDNYTAGISNTQRYKCLGNGWTVDVIAHILSYIPDVHLHNVVSLFDGISCGQVALGRANKTYSNYYASEIDKYAIAVAVKHYPNTIQLGDVTKIDWSELKGACEV